MSNSPIGLEKGASSEILDIISLRYDNIISKTKHPKIQMYRSQEKHFVFELDELPGVIIKMTTQGQELKERFKNIQFAREVCQTHHLGLLKIPQAILRQVTVSPPSQIQKSITLLLQEKLEIFHGDSMQEVSYETEADRLDKAINQLALFIIKTEFSDVEYRNVPIIKGEADLDGNRRFGLIDLEGFGEGEFDITMGLFGYYRKRTGLVRMVNKRQALKVIEIAKKELSWNLSLETDSKTAFEDRIRQLNENKRLKEFYIKRKIVKGNEVIKVDINSLDVPDNLQQPLQDIIEEININLGKDTPGKSLKTKRNIRILSLDYGKGLFPDPKEIPKCFLLNARMYKYSHRFPGETKNRFVFGDEKTILAVCLNLLIKHNIAFKKELKKYWYVQV